jgi:VWFA-related protein
MSRRATYIALSLGLFFAFSLSSLAQGGVDPLMNRVGPGAPAAYVPRDSPHAEQEGKLVFKSQTVLVQVPVVITDKSGTHVHGLTKDDFRLLENGKEQKITVAEEVNSSGKLLPLPSNPPGTFSNLAQNGEPARTVTIFVIDSINTPFLDQDRARRELIKFLSENADSGQVMGLVSIGGSGMHVLSGITNDPNVLIAALKKATGGIPAMQAANPDALAGATQINAGTYGPTVTDVETSVEQFIQNGDPIETGYVQARAIETTMRAFLDIANSVSGIPGRKALIWATGGFPFYLDSPSSVPGGDLSLLYERTMHALSDAQVAVYPVDARGLVNYSPIAEGSIGQGSAADSVMHGVGRSIQITNRSWLQGSTLDTLRDFAQMTGGRAFYNRNDLHNLFKRASDDSSSYYLIGYYLDTHNDKSGWRKLQVKVPQKSVEVHCRDGFFVTKGTLDPTLSRKLDIDTALLSPFESTGVPVTVRWMGTTGDGAMKKIAFAIHVPASGIMFDASQGNHFEVDFVARAAQNGKQAASVGQMANGAIPPAKMPEINEQGVRYSNALELPAGTYQVRFVVRDNLTGKIGSVSAPLTVN